MQMCITFKRLKVCVLNNVYLFFQLSAFTWLFIFLSMILVCPSSFRPLEFSRFQLLIENCHADGFSWNLVPTCIWYFISVLIFGLIRQKVNEGGWKCVTEGALLQRISSIPKYRNTELDLHRILSGFHGAFATGVASQQGTLTLPDTWFRPPFWDLLMLQLLRPNSSNLPCLYSTFHLEYPLVLSRFYFFRPECDSIKSNTWHWSKSMWE